MSSSLYGDYEYMDSDLSWGRPLSKESNLSSNSNSSVLHNASYDTSTYQDHHPAAIVVLCVIYGCISLTAFMGNVMVIWIICTGRRMFTVINLYIGNLALADVIIAVFCVPFQFQAALLYRWDLPAFMCKLCPFLQHLSINASIITLVIIALDRYRGIIWPLKGGYSKLRAKAIIGFIWVVSSFEAMPNLVFHVVTQEGQQLCLLDEAIMTPEQWDQYNFVMVLLQYVIPFIMISVTYGHMSLALWGMQTPGQAIDQRDLAILANKKKVTKMLFFVVLMFGICWFPFQMFNLLSSQIELNFRGLNYIWMASHILAMSNSSCNPIIYGIYNEKFRREFHRKLAGLLGRPTPPELNLMTLTQIPFAERNIPGGSRRSNGMKQSLLAERDGSRRINGGSGRSAEGSIASRRINGGGGGGGGGGSVRLGNRGGGQQQLMQQAETFAEVASLSGMLLRLRNDADGKENELLQIPPLLAAAAAAARDTESENGDPRRELPLSHELFRKEENNGESLRLNAVECVAEMGEHSLLRSEMGQSTSANFDTTSA